MTRAEFRVWTEAQPRGRYERASGQVVMMSPERVIHARLKMRVWRALDTAIQRAGLECEAFGDGVTVEIDDETDYEPDALVNCGPPIPPDSIAAPNPVIIVEVLSPSTQSIDAGGKLADYFRLPAVRHYLLVRPNRTEVIHHRRAGATIETQVIGSGPIHFDPPGITISIDDIYAEPQR